MLLEYEDEAVKVHDVRRKWHVAQWHQRVSARRKLRLSPDIQRTACHSELGLDYDLFTKAMRSVATFSDGRRGARASKRFRHHCGGGGVVVPRIS